MNKEEFAKYCFDEFPTAFETPFSRNLLINILDYASKLPTDNDAYLFLSDILPELSEREIQNFFI